MGVRSRRAETIDYGGGLDDSLAFVEKPFTPGGLLPRGRNAVDGGG